MKQRGNKRGTRTMCVWVYPGRKEGRKALRTVANTFAAIRNFYERRTKVSIPCRYRSEPGLNFAPSIMLVRASRRVALRRVAPRPTALGRAALYRRLVRTGQLNRSGGFSIFCLIVSTMAAAAQKWLSARNTRHYTPPYARAPFPFLSSDPRGSVFHLPTLFGLTVCADYLAHLRPT